MSSYWANTLFIIGLTASMAVNALVTALIVLRILNVTRVRRPTSVERTLGSTGSNKFRHIVFVIIESAAALFAIQLARVMMVNLLGKLGHLPFFVAADDFVIVTNQMLNVINPRSVHFFFRLADNILPG